jgi:hypothetical protein
MPMTQQQQQHERETLNVLLEAQVMHTLGKPGDLLKVQVRLLWEHHYRVNVLVGGDAASARIANSYFVKADGEGNIIASTPKITKQYGLVERGTTN